MKKLLLITLLLFSAISFAQDKFIEVEVADTITLRPERFEYVISISRPDSAIVYTAEYFAFSAKGEKIRYREISDNLQKLLKNKKYKFRSIYGRDTTDAQVVVEIKDTREVEDIEKLLRGVDFVYGPIGDVVYSDKQKTEEALYKKLLEKARAKAEVIATVSELKIGNVIEVREPEDIGGLEFNIHDTYFVTLGSKNMKMQNGKLVGSLSKTLIVRFAAQ